MTTPSRAVTHHGNDLYREITLPAAQTSFNVTYWDVWMLALLVGEFGGDWDKFADHFRNRLKIVTIGRDALEGFLNHLRLLRQTLVENDLRVDDVLGRDAGSLLKTERRTAKRKILDKSPQEWDRSPWMIHTPRKQREAHALRGNWGRFPVSPAHYAEPMARLFKPSGWYTENQSFALERKLSGFVDRKAARASLPELIALYRAFLTVIIEKMVSSQ